MNNNHTNNAANIAGKPAKAGTIAYLGLGANLGDRIAHIRQALRKLALLPTIDLVRISSVYETAPVGVVDQPEFLNLVAAVRTSLSPQVLLEVLLHIENQMGRVRTLRWGPRVIDIDLLLYGNAQIAVPGLTVPHPHLRERAFVLVPLAEIAPDLALPEDGKTVSELAEIIFHVSSQKGNIQKLDFV